MTTQTAPRRGRLIQTEGYIWECHDDECGCTEAVVVNVYENATVGLPWVIREALWTGDFHTDHESGADEELAAHRAALKQDDPALEARIVWQEGIDYGQGGQVPAQGSGDL